MFDLSWEEKLGFLVQQDHQMRDILLQKGVLSDAYHPAFDFSSRIHARMPDVH